MTNPIDIEERFAQLCREVGSRPELVQRVLEQVGDSPFREQRAPTVFGRARVSLGWTGAIAAALLIGVSLWLISTPRSLAAQILRALERVDTVHVTGSTSQVIRKWPLEKQEAVQPDANRSVPFEAWYWTDQDGLTRSYETQGPVTVVRRGGEMHEYQKDVDLLYVHENGYPKDRVARFSGAAEYFGALERPGMVKKELPTRREGDRTVAGLELRQGRQVRTIWWDAATMLPVRMSVSETSPDARPIETHLAFSYNQPVPSDLAAYRVPQTKNVRYAGSDKAALAWREHVEALGQRMNEGPLPCHAALIPRAGGRLFAIEWALATPDGRFLVTPVAGTLVDCLRLQIAVGEASRQLENWRVPAELRDLSYCHDVVFGPGVAWQEWVQVVLAHHGLEFVDVVEDRTVWVAHYDGHTQKVGQPVSPPVPYIVVGGAEKKGLVKCGVGMRLTPATLKTLFDDFNMLQARDGNGNSIIIEDQTGLPRPPEFNQTVHGNFKDYWRNVVEPRYVVATDSPYFRGPGSVEMARSWYRDNLGITFTEELRPMTVHVVRRKPN